jgi:hypothetical protein
MTAANTSCILRKNDTDSITSCKCRTKYTASNTSCMFRTKDTAFVYVSLGCNETGNAFTHTHTHTHKPAHPHTHVGTDVKILKRLINNMILRVTYYATFNIITATDLQKKLASFGLGF